MLTIRDSLRTILSVPQRLQHRTTPGGAHLFERAKHRLASWAVERLFGGDGSLPSGGASLFRTSTETSKRTTDALLQAFSERPHLAGPADVVSSDVGAIQWKLYAVRGGPDAERAWVRPTSLQRGVSPRGRRKDIEQLRDAGRLTEIEDHPLLDLLFRPNPQMDGAAWVKLVQLYYDLVGDAPNILITEPSGMLRGLPSAIWPVPVTWIRRRGETLFLDRPGTARPIPLDPDALLWLKDIDPHNPYGRGVGTARTLSDEIDIAEYAAKEIKSRLQNGTVPDLFLQIMGANDEEVRRYKAHLQGRHMGPFRRGGIEATNKEIKATKVSQTFADWQATDLIPMQRDAIRMRFGVPPEIIGDAKDSNRATITGAERIYNTRCIDPRMNRLRNLIQQHVAPLYDERLVLDYVSPIPEDEDFKLEVMKAAPKHFRRNEWRTTAGFVPVEQDEGGEDFYGSPLMVPEGEVRSVSGGAEVLKLVKGGRMVETRGRFTDEDAADVFWQAVQRVADRLEPQVRLRFLDAVAAMEDAMEEAAETIIRALRSGNVEAVLREIPWEAFRGRLAGAGDELRGLLLSAMEETGKLAAAEASEMLGAEISFTIENTRVIEAARNRAATLVREISDGQRDTIRQILARAYSENRVPDRDLFVELRDRIGLTTRQEQALATFERKLVDAGADEAQIARRVARQRNAVLRRRARTIGRTETIWSSNAGAHELTQQAIEQGVVARNSVRRFWVTTPDQRLCFVCEPMPFLDANQKVGPDDLFTTGDGTQVLHAPAHVACRCGVGWEVVDGQRSVRMAGVAKAVARLTNPKEEAA